MDTKFSSAIHALILISESETPMNSDQIAASVGTNPSYVRKLTTRLSKAGIIEGHPGVSGFHLLQKPEQISLFAVYRAVMETDSLHLFDLHQNPNGEQAAGHDACRLHYGYGQVYCGAQQRRIGGNDKMKAAVLTHYDKKGTELEIREISTPIPEEDEVLVKIMTAAVNPLDNMIIRGEVKLIVPYAMPLVMGNEFAGIVEKTGKNAARFKPGDRVYGRMPLKKIGAFAEYAAVKETALAVIPEYLSFEEAATVPLTALTAMQAFEVMDVHAGESVFISGGTGSLGAMAIPVAKSLGLHVYTNGSGENEEHRLQERKLCGCSLRGGSCPGYAGRSRASE